MREHTVYLCTSSHLREVVELLAMFVFVELLMDAPDATMEGRTREKLGSLLDKGFLMMYVKFGTA